MDVSQTERRRMVASTKMWMIRQYAHDLAEFYAGDQARFNRMVVDGGKSIPTGHPHGWAQHITNCAAEAIEFYRDEIETIYERLRAWGHDAQLQAAGDD